MEGLERLEGFFIFVLAGKRSKAHTKTTIPTIPFRRKLFADNVLRYEKTLPQPFHNPSKAENPSNL